MHPSRALLLAVALTAAAVVLVFLLKRPAFPECLGMSQCFSEKITRVIDGDTIESGSARIRLVLVNTPEKGEPGFDEATKFTSDLCLGRPAIIDEDDWQGYDSYGRMLAVVHCNGTNINEALLKSGHAALYRRFCAESEFGAAEWARKAGC